MARTWGVGLCLVACSDYAYLSPEQTIDEWVVRGNVDIVVFGDTSDSMRDTLALLTGNIVRFVSRLEEARSDWHLIAITGPDGCARGGVLKADTPRWEEAFTEGITVRPAEDLVDEWGLYNAQQALARSVTGGCNEGFLRDDAYLHIVFISDEDDNSPGFDGPDPDYWRPYVDAYLSAKANNPSRLHLSAVGGPAPLGCSFADFSRGYWEAVLATEGDFLSICDDWVSELDALADASIVRDSFRLDAPARPDSIRVFVDGLERLDWSYDGETRTVTFAEAEPPHVGQSVKVRYAVADR